MYTYIYIHTYIHTYIFICIHINPQVSCLKSQICWEQSPFSQLQLHVSGCPRRALCTDAVYGGPGAGVS